MNRLLRPRISPILKSLTVKEERGKLAAKQVETLLVAWGGRPELAALKRHRAAVRSE